MTLDISSPKNAYDIILRERPWLVVNTAAYTAVDRAESESELASRINEDAPGQMAKACQETGAILIHVSTDYVFDGSASKSYRETGLVQPLNVYGASKLKGETLVRAACERHIILRTSWLFASHGNNFVRTMLRLALERDTISIVDDQLGIPTDARSLAFAIIKMAERLANGNNGAFGIFHAVGGPRASWFEFAEAIFNCARQYSHPVPRLQPISSERYPTPALRPRFSVLDCSALEREWNISVPSWKADLDSTVQSIIHDLGGGTNEGHCFGRGRRHAPPSSYASDFQAIIARL
jgi:dTDP-4-dehydrorhamnose reductase